MTLLWRPVLNYKGFETHLWKEHRVNPKVTSAFLNGFGEADPLFHVLNVGSNKEAADIKVKGSTEVYVSSSPCACLTLN